jgi:hypothetical protein
MAILSKVFMVDIEWDDWSSKPYVYTWQAAALVQGLNPKKIKFPVRDAAGELHFDRSNFGNAYPEFKVKLDLVIEHAWIHNFSAQNMRVDFKRFLYWAHHVQKWSMPSPLLAFAQNLNLDALTDVTDEADGNLRDERNSLQLIWALRQLLNDHPYGKTDRELIYYLSKTHPEQPGFKRLALEMKFAEAKVASDS